MRIIVCGSRTFMDYTLLQETLDRLTRKLDKAKLVILSGHTRGADTLAEHWCFVRHVSLEVYHPDHNTHGKAAPHVRNREMVEAADALVAFWDGESPGTASIVALARKKKLKVRVVRF